MCCNGARLLGTVEEGTSQGQKLLWWHRHTLHVLLLYYQLNPEHGNGAEDEKLAAQLPSKLSQGLKQQWEPAAATAGDKAPGVLKQMGNKLFLLQC